MAGVIFALPGCSSEDAAKSPETPTPATVATATSPIVQSAAPPPQIKTPRLGEEAVDDVLSFVVTKATGSDTTAPQEHPDNPFLQTHAQNLYLIVYLRVKNISRIPQTFYASNQKLRTADREFAADQQAAINAGSYRIDINPGNTADAVLAFDCPPDVLTRTNTGFNSKIKFIKLRSTDASPGVYVSLRQPG